MAEESKDPFAGFEAPIPQPTINEEEMVTQYCKAYSQDDKIDTLSASMAKYDDTNVNVQVIRQKLANKLLSDVMKMDLSVVASTDPDLFAAQAKMISEARGLLNDIDGSSKSHTAMKLKHKDSETQASVAFNAAELLSKIKLSVAGNVDGSLVVDNSDEIEDLIAKQFDDPDSLVLDTELEMGGNMLPERKDSDDK
jgi:hypothetical protein